MLTAVASPIAALNPAARKGVMIDDGDSERGESGRSSDQAGKYLGDIDVPVSLQADIARLQIQLEAKKPREFAPAFHSMIDLWDEKPRSMIDLWDEESAHGTKAQVGLMSLSEVAGNAALPGSQDENSDSLIARPGTLKAHAHGYRCFETADCK